MAIYYVDATGGDDEAAGTSEGTAWQTISKVKVELYSPGDSVLFKRGETWTETLTFPSSGTSGNEITIGAYGSGALPVIDSEDTRDTGIDLQAVDYVNLEYLNVLDAVVQNVFTSGGTHVFTGVDASGSGDQNYQITNASDATFIDCNITGAADDGISRHGGSIIKCTNCTFADNSQDINDDGNAAGSVTVSGCTFSGSATGLNHLLVTCAVTAEFSIFSYGNTYNRSIDDLRDGSTIDYCIFQFTGTDVSDQCLKGHSAAGTVTLRNCVFYSANGAGYCLLPLEGQTWNIYNCIFDNFTYAVWLYYACTVNTYTCDFYSLTGVSTDTTGTLNQSGSITTDPMFVTPGSDYHLQEGSDCIEAGTDVGLTKDYEGTLITGNPEIGAFEYVAGGIQALSGSSVGVSTGSGAVLYIQKALSGSTSGLGGESGAINLIRFLSGSTDGLSTTGGILNIQKAFSALVNGVSNAVGSIIMSYNIIGSSTGKGGSRAHLTIVGQVESKSTFGTFFRRSRR